VNAAEAFFAWLKRNRRYKIDQSPVKLNLGSGLVHAAGWINIDIGLYSALKPWPHWVLRRLYRKSGWRVALAEDEYVRLLKNGHFIQHDLARGIPFPDATVDYLFASHFLDSLTQAQGEMILAEAFRVLRPDGMIRISVSDLDKNIELYATGKREEALARFFPQSQSRPNLRYFMYDWRTLQSALARAGFVDIGRREYQVGDLPEVELLDNRPEESLFVEAHKRLAR
jgi:predicted SAM-dependent methyltransferase